VYVGSNYQTRNRKKNVTVIFERCYRFPPLSIHANASGQPGNIWPDTYRVEILAVSTHGFTARVERLDRPTGWGQTVTMHWKAVFGK